MAPSNAQTRFSLSLLACIALTLPAAAEAMQATSTAPARQITIPAGTIVHARLQHALASNISVVGDRVEAELLDPVHVAGELALPAGSKLRGYVRSVKGTSRAKGRSGLDLLFHEIELPGGVRTAINASWSSTAPGAVKRDTGIIGGSAAGGALLGQLINKDSEGTIRGGLLGGAVGTGVVLLNKGKDLRLRPGTILIMETATATSVPVVPTF